MLETITIAKSYSNREIAEILGCAPETVRQVKSRKADQLEGLWSQDGSSETVWSQEGLEKLSELINTEKSVQFRSSALTRRTQEAIAVDRAEISYQNDIDNISTRTGHEVNSYEVQNPTSQGGRYDALPKRIGTAIGDALVENGAVQQIDNAVVNRLLKELSIGDIDIETLLSN